MTLLQVSINTAALCWPLSGLHPFVFKLKHLDARRNIQNCSINVSVVSECSDGVLGAGVKWSSC